MLSSKPLYEDMKRRGWMKGEIADWGLFLSFMLTPLIGVCTWLAVRPELKPAVVANSQGVVADVGAFSDGALPAGWQAGTDAATGDSYYYNDKGETSWERPS